MVDVKEQEINQLIEKYSDELTEDQIRVLPLISFGMTAAKVSKITNVSAVSIRQWMRTDQKFRSALHQFQGYTNLYHMTMLNQAGALAWDRIFEILEADYSEEDKIGRTNQAQMAKFVIAELDINGNKIEEKKEAEAQLFVTESSADLIARRVAEIQNEKPKTAEATYQVGEIVKDDVRHESNSMEAAERIDEEFIEIEQAKEGPLYPKHPHTNFGELTYNSSGTKICCHYCGKFTSDLVIHIRNEHKMSPSRYRELYQLPSDIKFGLTKPVIAEQEDIDKYNKELEENILPNIDIINQDGRTVDGGM